MLLQCRLWQWASGPLITRISSPFLTAFSSALLTTSAESAFAPLICCVADADAIEQQNSKINAQQET